VYGGDSTSLGMQRKEDSESDEEIPLLDEINDLLEKERTLLGLKVAEQQIEALEWKTKYEQLVNKLSENATDVEIFEIAGDIDRLRLYPSIGVDLDQRLQYQYSSPHSWCLDTSGIEIHRLELKKILNYPKSHSHGAVSVLQLHHSDIQDKDADLVMLLLNFPRLESLDLSFNELGTEFHSSLLQSIEVSPPVSPPSPSL
jgi:hypothetical protein